MNMRAVFAIVRKDLKVVRQNKGVMLPIILVLLMMFVVLPWGVALVPTLVNKLGFASSDVNDLIALMPADLQQEFSGLSIDQSMIVYILKYFMAPLFMLIPLMVSLTIAADSFAGEKERKTLEALLYTPTTDRELFVAKLLSSWLGAITVALTGFVLYVVMANAAAWSYMHHIFFPNATWLVIILWVVPALPGLGLGVMVMVSARAQGFQDAYQIGSVVVLPIVLLIFGQTSGVISLNITFALLMGLVIWMLDSVLIWFGSRSFRRNRLLAD
jgi:ABC-2 type transport system permease protein